MASSPDAYEELAKQSEHDVGVEGALISMVEPGVGVEREYNRWYEDDHYYSGALNMPWMFAGRRFVATRDLQRLRYPADSPIAQPLRAGCYLHLYWISPGHVEDHVAWSVGTNNYLRAENRIHLDRTHIYTSFQDRLGTWSRDVSGPRDLHSLDYPYQGVVMEVIDAPEGGDRSALEDHLRRSYLPWLYRTPDNPIAQTLWFAPQPLPAGKQPDVADVPGLDRRLTLIHFLDGDPRDCWDTYFADNGTRLGDVGVMQLAAPFIPVLTGTDRYVDELR